MLCTTPQVLAPRIRSVPRSCARPKARIVVAATAMGGGGSSSGDNSAATAGPAGAAAAPRAHVTGLPSPNIPLPVAPQDINLAAAAEKFGWDLDERPDYSDDPKVRWLPIAEIRRPVPRSNNLEKVAALMKSIEEIGQQEPIDVLEVEGQYWSFSGCHRYEAHQRLGKEEILCRVRKAPRSMLRFHM